MTSTLRDYRPDKDWTVHDQCGRPRFRTPRAHISHTEAKNFNGYTISKLVEYQQSTLSPSELPLQSDRVTTVPETKVSTLAKGSAGERIQ